MCGVSWGAHAPFLYVHPFVFLLISLDQLDCSTYLASQTSVLPGNPIPTPSLIPSSAPIDSGPSPPPMYGLSAPSINSSTAELLAPRTVPPISVFRPPQPSQGNVAQQRRESAQRTLPQHSGSQGSRSSSRRSGPRNSFPTSLSPTPFDPVTAVVPASTSSRATPAVRNLNVVFVIVPFCVRHHICFTSSKPTADDPCS